MNQLEQKFISAEQAPAVRVLGSGARPVASREAGPSQRSVNTAEHQLMALELHDAISQTLFAANLLAGTLVRTAGNDASLRGQAQILERLNRSALSEMRLMLFELQPEVLYSIRMPELLQRAVEALEGRGDIRVETSIDDSSPLAAEQRIEVYRIAQAALSNIARHSAARQARLRWCAPIDGPASLHISDDGQGFAPEEHSAGVNSIRARASRLGANLVISSLRGAGTDLILTISRKGTPT